MNPGKLRSIVALVLFAPAAALAELTDTQRCALAKLKASATYAACRLKAVEKATKSNAPVDITKCDPKLQSAYDKADSSYGAECARGNPPTPIGTQFGGQVNDLACRLTAPMTGPAGTLLIFDVPDAAALSNEKFYIRNSSYNSLLAQCFFASTGKRCSDTASACSGDSECVPTGTCVDGCNVAGAGFSVFLLAQADVFWDPRLGTGGVPGFPAGFTSGQIVCVELDESGSPYAANSLLGGSAIGDACPTATAIHISGGEAANSDGLLNLGLPDQYDSCPASIPTSVIETCWSQSRFTFTCY